MQDDDDEDAAWALLLAECGQLGGRGVPSAANRCSNPACSSQGDVDRVCRACGTVAADQSARIDTGAEWRYFSNGAGKDPDRCGMPGNDLLPVSSMSTCVGPPARGRYSKSLANVSRFQQWNSMPHKERSLYAALDSVAVKAVNHGVSQSIIEEAKVTYKRVSELRASRGDNRAGLMAASIYVACKNNGVPRSAKEIADMFGLAVASVTRGTKTFQELMNIRLGSSAPEDYVGRFCSQLELDPETHARCAALVKRVHDEKLLTEHTPLAIVAGCICAASTPDRATRLRIVQVCGVSDATVTKVSKKLRGARELAA